MPAFHQLRSRLFNTPQAILPAKAEEIIIGLSDRLGIARLARADGRQLALAPPDLDDGDYAEVPSGYDVVAGIAVISVQGTLVQKLGSLRPYSGMTGYDGIRQNFVTALVDPAVEAICLDIDSPGGEVAGCFDLVDMIYDSRGIKPIGSILGENAYSAAYAIASAADPGRLYVPRTGGTGSVGVIYMHVSFEQFLEKAGIEVTLITKGDLKGEGSEVKALSDGAYKRMKADILTVGDLFDRTVARNRGMAVSDVFDTQAGTFLGKKGADVGFADQVAAPDHAFRALHKSLG